MKFYRHMRFFDNGRMLYSLDTVEPDDMAKHLVLGSEVPKKIFEGKYTLIGKQVHVEVIAERFQGNVYITYRSTVHLVKTTSLTDHLSNTSTHRTPLFLISLLNTTGRHALRCGSLRTHYTRRTRRLHRQTQHSAHDRARISSHI